MWITKLSAKIVNAYVNEKKLHTFLIRQYMPFKNSKNTTNNCTHTLECNSMVYNDNKGCLRNPTGVLEPLRALNDDVLSAK